MQLRFKLLTVMSKRKSKSVILYIKQCSIMKIHVVVAISVIIQEARTYQAAVNFYLIHIYLVLNRFFQHVDIIKNLLQNASVSQGGREGRESERRIF